MKKKCLVMAMAVLFFTSVVPAFSQNNASAIQNGNILLNAGFGLGRFGFPFTFFDTSYGTEVGFNNALLFGISVSVDYALPIAFPLTIGLEAGYMAGAAETISDTANLNPFFSGTIIMLRAAWHPDLFNVSNLNTYLLFKFGYAFGTMDDPYLGTEMVVGTEPAGIGVGLGIGVRYFFGKRFGILAELGYERFFANFSGEAWWKSNPGNKKAFDGKIDLEKYITIGLTWKF